MKKIHTYQPGDPEWIVIQKQFHELQQEERDALKEWIDSEDTYNQMRSVLMALHDDGEEWLEPDVSIKANLMAKFSSEEKGGRLIWLNALAWSSDTAWFKQPLFKTGLAAACIVGLAVFFLVPSAPKQAENQIAEVTIPADTTTAWSEAKQDTAGAEIKEFAAVRSELPPAPMPVMVQSETSENLDSDDVEAVMADGYSAAEMDMAPQVEEAKSAAPAPEMTMQKKENQAAGISRANALSKDEQLAALAPVGIQSVNIAQAKIDLSGLFTAR
jgi:hypothetical protein